MRVHFSKALHFTLQAKNKMMYPFCKQMKQESIVLEDFELARLLTITRDAIRKARQKELDQFNVHIRRASLLKAIDSLGDKATPVNIAQWLLRERHTVSELLDKMESGGLVEKIRGLDRKNRVRVVLTPKGLKTYEKSRAGTVFPRVVSSLTKSEREHLKVCLRLLRNEALKSLGRSQSGKLTDQI